MAKRFTDTDIWKHEWFHNLSQRQKCLWFLICDECDSIGVWPINLRLASFYIGDTATEDDLSAFGWGKRVVRLKADKLWIPGFITFQYRTLNHTNRAHLGIMRSILRAVDGLPLEGDALELIQRFRDLTLGRPSVDPQQTLDEGHVTPQEKEKDKDKDKDKEKEEGGVGETEPPLVDRFETAWRQYPRKIEKTSARDRFKRLIKSESDFQSLLLAITNYANKVVADQTDKKFVKHFASFLGTEHKQVWRDWVNPEDEQREHQGLYDLLGSRDDHEVANG